MKISTTLSASTLLLTGLAVLPCAAQTPASGAQASGQPAPAGAAGSSAAGSTGGFRSAEEEFADPEWFRDYRLNQQFHPIGPVVPRGKLRFTNYIPMYPAGFRSDNFSLAVRPVFGLGGGWEATAGAMQAERLGAGGEAIFYGAGLQKQFVHETSRQPSISLGGYGMIGPHDHRTANFYLAATKRVAGTEGAGFGLFLHGGAKYELFDGDDYGDDSGIQPFVATTIALQKRVFLNAEFSPKQSWQGSNMFSLQGTYLFTVKGRRIGFSAGIQNTGYDTGPQIGITF